MKAKITAQLVAALQPAERPYDVNDTDLHGFQLRVHPSGTKTFLCVYRLRGNGRKNRYVIGRTPPLTPTQARDEAKKVLGDVARGIDPNEAKRERQREQRNLSVGIGFGVCAGGSTEVEPHSTVGIQPRDIQTT